MRIRSISFFADQLFQPSENGERLGGEYIPAVDGFWFHRSTATPMRLFHDQGREFA